MDPIIKYLWSIGYTSKQTHNLKAKDKINILAKHFGFKKVPTIKRDYARAFLKELRVDEELNPETFRLQFMSFLNDRFNNVFAPTLNEHQLTIVNLPADKFYQTPEWRELRYRSLDHHGNSCYACGRSPKDGVIIHVDHILPRSIYPEHALNFENMQILCEDCNLGKSNKYETNWKLK